MSDEMHTERELLNRSLLASRELYRGPDVEVAGKALAQILGVTATARATGDRRVIGNSGIRGARMSHLTFGIVEFGADCEVSIVPQNAYHLILACNAETTSFCGARRVSVTTDKVILIHPRESILIPRWPAGMRALCVQVHPGSLESELSTQLGRPIGLPSLELVLELATAGGQSFASTLDLLIRELDEEDSLANRSRSYSAQLERLVLSSILRAVQHEYSDELVGDTAPARWSAVKRAIEALEEAPEHQWTLAEIAQVAGVGSRRLQQGFRQQVGVSPMTFLRAVRLYRVHRELLDGVESIGETAARWGFTHAGRFAAAYRRRYGETPRQTQRRSAPFTFSLGRTA
ncbi:helix-turn-helix transcriptional regulator [Microbacterium sp. NPDC089696]|uniref:helix-turn-helix transcriptional regulator n=1 Tax=Microbacterium sp. NPDC089696 TaxID=3364199 RepID=UPI00380D88C1